MKVIYIGAFLTPESREQLLAAVPARHGTVFAEHITLAFKPAADNPLFQRLGEEVAYTLLGSSSDERGQAVLISAGPEMMGQNEIPHITVSCAEGTKPVYSNELLALDGWDPLPVQFTLQAVVKAVVNRGNGVEHVTSLDG